MAGEYICTTYNASFPLSVKCETNQDIYQDYNENRNAYHWVMSYNTTEWLKMIADLVQIHSLCS